MFVFFLFTFMRIVNKNLTSIFLSNKAIYLCIYNNLTDISNSTKHPDKNIQVKIHIFIYRKKSLQPNIKYLLKYYINILNICLFYGLVVSIVSATKEYSETKQYHIICRTFNGKSMYWPICRHEFKFFFLALVHLIFVNDTKESCTKISFSLMHLYLQNNIKCNWK